MPTSHLTDKSFESLAIALRCWIDFQIHCGREQLLSESYMTQPIGEFLMAHYSGFLHREENHPQFKKAKSGRPKQVDYVLKSREKRLFDFAVECKWIGSTKPTRQSIVDDVMRLECLRRPTGDQGSCNRFFILAGRKKTVASFFKSRINKTGEKPAPLFIRGFLPTEEAANLGSFKVRQCKKYYRAFFKDFSEGYDSELPRSYRVRLVASKESEESQVYIWKIGSMGKRTPFDLSEWRRSKNASR
jgi:hypothetical protein